MKTILFFWVVVSLLAISSDAVASDDIKLGIAYKDKELADENLRNITKDDFPRKYELLELKHLSSSVPVLNADGVQVATCEVLVGEPSSESPILFFQLTWESAAKILKRIPESIEYYDVVVNLEFSDGDGERKLRMPENRTFHFASPEMLGRRIDFRFDEDIVNTDWLRIHIKLEAKMKEGNVKEGTNLALDLSEFVADFFHHP